MAYETATGTVGKIKEREWKNLVFSSFTLEEGDEWYGMGTEKVTFQEGDVISFRWETDKKGYPAVKGKVRAESAGDGTSAPAAQSSSPPTTVKGGTSGGGRDTYWADKEKKDDAKNARYQAIDVPRMSFSAAQGRAVELVSAALAADAIGFGSTAKGKRLDLLCDFVDQVTDRFVLQAADAPEHLIDLQREREMWTVASGGGEKSDAADVAWGDE